MKTCRQCAQDNPDDAQFCLQCGTRFDAETETGGEPASALPPEQEDAALWRAFIGPQADHYLERFRKFTGPGGPRFALTWHWPAFLVEPFLWFLYRKMYMYAAVYAVGPVISALVTNDVSVGIVWRIMAGATAHYLYFWHVKDHVSRIQNQARTEPSTAARLLADLGGVQRYVIWVGVAMYALFAAMVVEMIRQGPPPSPNGSPAKPAPASSRLLT